MTFIDDQLLLWSLALIVGFPLAVLGLTELISRLDRRNSALAEPLAQVRNLVLPALALLLFLRYLLGVEEGTLLIRGVETLFWVALLFVGYRLLNELFSPREPSPGWRDTVPALLLQLPRFVLIVGIITLVLTRVWQIDVGEMVTALGIGSLVVALALQDTLSNLFSGLLLLLNRPFQVGDWLRTGDVEGQVFEVNWRNASVRTRDNDLVIIPNGSLAKSSFKNYSMPSRLHRVGEEIEFHVLNPPNRVRKVLVETAMSTPGVLASPPPDARTMAYDGIAVRYKIFFWIEDYGPVAHVRNRFLTRLHYQATRAGLKWPIPQQEILVYDGPAMEEIQRAGTGTFSDILTHLPAFATLDPAAIPRLTGSAELLDFGEDERIVRAGQNEAGVYVLVDGRVALRFPDEPDAPPLVELEHGDIFGESGLFGRAVSAVDAVALSDVRALLIPRSAMNEVIARNPIFADAMNALLQGRKRLIERHRQSLDQSLNGGGETTPAGR